MNKERSIRLDRRELSSSVVIRGLDATTFAQMEHFVDDLEAQPLDRLLRDLPKLARLSTTKFALVSYVIAGKFKNAPEGEKKVIRNSVQNAVAAELDAETRKRLGKILERLK